MCLQSSLWFSRSGGTSLSRVRDFNAAYFLLLECVLTETGCSRNDQRDLRANELIVYDVPEEEGSRAGPPLHSHGGDVQRMKPEGSSEKRDHIFPSSDAYVCFLHGSRLATSDLLCV